MSILKYYLARPKVYISLLVICLSLFQTTIILDNDLNMSIFQGRVSLRAMASMRIAQNIAEGRGVTFDGESAAKLYSPLWVYLVSVVFRIAGDPTTSAILLLMLCQALFHFGLIIILIWLSKRLGNLSIFFATAVFVGLFPGIKIALIDGSETTLVFFFLSILMLILEPPTSGLERRGAIWRGVGGIIVLIALILTRPDIAIFAVLFGLIAFLKCFRAKTRDVKALAGFFMLIFGNYMGFKIIDSGMFVPAGSLAPELGIVKPFMRIFTGLEPSFSLPIAVKLSIALVFIAFAIISWKRAKPSMTAIASSIAARIIIFSGLVAPIAEDSAFFAIDAVLIAIALAYFIFIALKKLFGEKHGALAAVVLAVAAVSVQNLMPDIHSPRRRGDIISAVFASSWMGNNLPEDARLAAFEPEIPAFISQRDILDLGGRYSKLPFKRSLRVPDSTAAFILSENVEFLFGRWVIEDTTGGITFQDSITALESLPFEYSVLVGLEDRLKILRHFSRDFYIFQIVDSSESAEKTLQGEE